MVCSSFSPLSILSRPRRLSARPQLSTLSESNSSANRFSAMRHHGPSSFFASWIHPLSPSQHEEKGNRNLDPQTKPIPPHERPKRCLFPFFTCWSKRKAPSSVKTLDDDDEIRTVAGLKEFTYDELVQATANFSTARKLGEGRSGDVYRGQLASGMAVSVERYRELGGSSQEEHTNIAEVKSLSCLDHQNLVKLIGWCQELGQHFLVSEYMANGTLHEHLFGDMGRRTIPWWGRYKVVLSLASAVCYLHNDLKESVPHKNINSHNVVLDEEFNMKLGGLVFCGQTDHGISSATTAVANAQSYVAPELSELGESTTASDVYSFGVVALEIATGRDSSQYASTLGHGFLVQWVWRCYEYEILLEASDETLMGKFDSREMEQLMVVGLWCTHRDPAQRPQMAAVLGVLQFQEVSPIPVPPGSRVPEQCHDLSPDRSPTPSFSRSPPGSRVPEQYHDLSPDSSPTPSFSRSLSVSSACDSDLDDCLR